VDIDSFFASVVLRNHPELKEKIVVICHGGRGANSTSEIATCNYAARDLGIKKGSYLSKAQEICSQRNIELVILGFDFKGFDEVSAQLWEVLGE